MQRRKADFAPSPPLATSAKGTKSAKKFRELNPSAAIIGATARLSSGTLQQMLIFLLCDLYVLLRLFLFLSYFSRHCGRAGARPYRSPRTAITAFETTTNGAREFASTLGRHSQRMLIEIMKSAKLLREQNPYLLTGRGRKRRWFFLRAKTAKPESEV